MTKRPGQTGKPANLDGEWSDGQPEDGYNRHFAGPAEVRFHTGYEPDGELVTRARVNVHMERMSPGHWSVILTGADGHDIHVSFHSKKRIDVLWQDQP